MSKYTTNELLKRNKIIKSHALFGNCLNSDIVNKLIHIFDETHNDYSPNKIINLLEKERIKQGLDNSNIIIKSELYGETKSNPTLFVKIIKNGVEFLHLSIHLCATDLDPHKTGIIHISKNIYKESVKNKLSIRGLKKFQKNIYALISVEQSKNNQDSLVFSIADGYTTNKVKNITNANIYDPILQKEMNAIINVLNILFNEANVGNNYSLTSIHEKTNNVLNIINKYTMYSSRKNRGVKMMPQLTNNSNIINKSHKRVRIKKRGATRKIYK